MSREQIIAAIESGRPFQILMADGKVYDVPHRDYISIPPRGAFVIVFTDEGGAYYLPMLTMTGIAYPVDPAAQQMQVAP